MAKRYLIMTHNFFDLCKGCCLLISYLGINLYLKLINAVVPEIVVSAGK